MGDLWRLAPRDVCRVEMALHWLARPQGHSAASHFLGLGSVIGRVRRDPKCSDYCLSCAAKLTSPLTHPPFFVYVRNSAFLEVVLRVCRALFSVFVVAQAGGDMLPRSFHCAYRLFTSMYRCIYAMRPKRPLRLVPPSSATLVTGPRNSGTHRLHYRNHAAEQARCHTEAGFIVIKGGAAGGRRRQAPQGLGKAEHRPAETDARGIRADGPTLAEMLARDKRRCRNESIGAPQHGQVLHERGAGQVQLLETRRVRIDRRRQEHGDQLKLCQGDRRCGGCSSGVFQVAPALSDLGSLHPDRHCADFELLARPHAHRFAAEGVCDR